MKRVPDGDGAYIRKSSDSGRDQSGVLEKWQMLLRCEEGTAGKRSPSGRRTGIFLGIREWSGVSGN